MDPDRVSPNRRTGTETDLDLTADRSGAEIERPRPASGRPTSRTHSSAPKPGSFPSPTSSRPRCVPPRAASGPDFAKRGGIRSFVDAGDGGRGVDGELRESRRSEASEKWMSHDHDPKVGIQHPTSQVLRD